MNEEIEKCFGKFYEEVPAEVMTGFMPEETLKGLLHTTFLSGANEMLGIVNNKL